MTIKIKLTDGSTVTVKDATAIHGNAAIDGNGNVLADYRNETAAIYDDSAVELETPAQPSSEE